MGLLLKRKENEFKEKEIKRESVGLKNCYINLRKKKQKRDKGRKLISVVD